VKGAIEEIAKRAGFPEVNCSSSGIKWELELSVGVAL